MVYWGNHAYGVAPKTLVITLPQNTATTARDDYNLRAIWPSGAEAKGFRLNPRIKEGSVTLSRPPNAPGLDKDLAYAAQLAQMEAQQRNSDDWQILFNLWLLK